MWYQCKMKDGSTRWLSQAVFEGNSEIAQVLQSTDRDPFHRTETVKRDTDPRTNSWELPPYA